MSESFSLLLPFDTDEPDFIRGVEIGRLWEIAKTALETGDEVEETLHAVNAEMVLRVAEALGMEARSEELGGGWLLVTLVARDRNSAVEPPEEVKP